EGEAKRQRLQLVTADEAARRIVPRLVGDDSGHGGATVEMHRLLEDAIDRAGRMPHVVLADLTGRVREAVGEHRRMRVQEQPRTLDRVAGNGDDARFLLVQLAVLVGIDDAGYLARL